MSLTVIVAVPAPVIVTVPPESTVATAELLLLYVMAPEPPVAVLVNGLSAYVALMGPAIAKASGVGEAPPPPPPPQAASKHSRAGAITFSQVRIEAPYIAISR
jgi:hypothetical protein